MSVVVPKVNDTKFSTANGFYRVEDYNMGEATGWTALGGRPYAIGNVTFANAGNVIGCEAFLRFNTTVTSANGIMGMICSQILTFTVVAATNVFTATGHTYVDGDMIVFYASTAVPAGLIYGRPYYVINAGVNTFKVSATLGGTEIDIIDTGSGTLQCAIVYARGTCDRTKLVSTSAYRYNFNVITSIDFTTFRAGGVLAVTTDANKYWIVFSVYTSRYGGVDTVEDWAFTYTANVITPDYLKFAVWCDNQLSLSDEDTLIVSKHTYIDATKILSASALGLGTTVWAPALVIGVDNVYPYMFETEDTVLGSYSLTLKGVGWISSHSGIRIGRSTAPVSVANQFSLIWSAPTYGSNITDGFRMHDGNYWNMSIICARFEFYGAVPTKAYTTLTTAESLGATAIEVNDDMTTHWANGDSVVIGKLVQSAGWSGMDTTVYTIGSITATTVNLTGGLAYAGRAINGVMAKVGGYGIKITSTNTGVFYLIKEGVPLTATFSGVLFTDIEALYGYSDNAAYCPEYSFFSEWSINDCFSVYTKSINNAALVSYQTTGPIGLTMNRCLSWRNALIYKPQVYNGGASYGQPFSSGTVEAIDCIVMEPQCPSFGGYESTTLPNLYVKNFQILGRGISVQSPSFDFQGINNYYENVYVWIHGPSGYGLQFYYLVNPTKIKTISTNGGYGAIYITNALTKGVKIEGLVLTDIYDKDIYTASNAFIDVHFEEYTVDGGVSTSAIQYAIEGSKLSFSNYNKVVNDDKGYFPYYLTQRCGTSLTDTTVHSAGTGKFSLRLQPTSSTKYAWWKQTVPTGNIQNKDMQVSVWVKINNAAYWAGTNSLPRLTIDYDNGTEAYCQASETTDWQKLYLNFTPLTTYGEIYMSVRGNTDATTTNAYFYIDDVSILYPTGVALDLSGLDIWAQGLPVTPTITQVNADAGTVLDAAMASHINTNSVGAKLNSLKNASYIVDGEVIL